MTTIFKEDSMPLQEDQGEQVDADNGEIPGEELRRKTAKRKDKVHASDSDQSEGSWEEIRSNLDRDARKKPTRGDHDRRRTEKRDSLDSAMSSGKRAAIHNSLSSHEPGNSVRRPTDLSQPANTRYKNEHIRDLPRV